MFVPFTGSEDAKGVVGRTSILMRKERPAGRGLDGTQEQEARQEGVEKRC